MISETQKSVSKISLALLIVVISLTSTQASPNMHAKICRDFVSSTFKHAYEPKHRKCFVAGTERIYWNEAKNWCQQLPRIKHFGPPALATIDLNGFEMQKFLTSTMNARPHTTFWTGAYIPDHWVSLTKFNNEWRWVADNSRLSATHHAWQEGRPHKLLIDSVCAEITTTHQYYVGMVDTVCSAYYHPLCQYQAEEPKDPLCQYQGEGSKSCPYPSLPGNSHLSDHKKQYPSGTAVIVRCNDGYVVKEDPCTKVQSMICQYGQWSKNVKDCVADHKKK